MAKALFLSLPLHGHVNPSLPLVRELVARGDEVVYRRERAIHRAHRRRRARAIWRIATRTCPRGCRRLPERTEGIVWLLTETARRVLETELDTFRLSVPTTSSPDSVAPWGDGRQRFSACRW